MKYNDLVVTYGYFKIDDTYFSTEVRELCESASKYEMKYILMIKLHTSLLIIKNYYNLSRII